MATRDVFPRRNLPGDAENWGRAVEARILDLENMLDNLEQNTLATNRALAGALGTMGRQVTELEDMQNVVETSISTSIPVDGSDVSVWQRPLPVIPSFISGTGFIRVYLECGVREATLSAGFYVRDPSKAGTPGEYIISKFHPNGVTGTGWWTWSLAVLANESRAKTWYQSVPVDTPLEIGVVARANNGGGILTSCKLNVQAVPKP